MTLYACQECENAVLGSFVNPAPALSAAGWDWDGRQATCSECRKEK